MINGQSVRFLIAGPCSSIGKHKAARSSVACGFLGPAVPPLLETLSHDVVSPFRASLKYERNG